MSSLLRSTAQNLTQSFVVTQDSNEGVGETGAYYFTQSQIDSWYESNKPAATKLSDGLYIMYGTASGTTFVDVILGNGPGEELGGPGHNTPSIPQRKTLKDMGKEVIFGNYINARLLVLRRVQKYVLSTDGGSLDPNDTVYIVVENNDLDLQANTGRFTVRVARV